MTLSNFVLRRAAKPVQGPVYQPQPADYYGPVQLPKIWQTALGPGEPAVRRAVRDHARKVDDRGTPIPVAYSALGPTYPFALHEGWIAHVDDGHVFATKKGFELNGGWYPPKVATWWKRIKTGEPMAKPAKKSAKKQLAAAKATAKQDAWNRATQPKAAKKPQKAPDAPSMGSRHRPSSPPTLSPPPLGYGPSIGNAAATADAIHEMNFFDRQAALESDPAAAKRLRTAAEIAARRVHAPVQGPVYQPQPGDYYGPDLPRQGPRRAPALRWDTHYSARAGGPALCGDKRARATSPEGVGCTKCLAKLAKRDGKLSGRLAEIAQLANEQAQPFGPLPQPFGPRYEPQRKPPRKTSVQLAKACGERVTKAQAREALTEARAELAREKALRRKAGARGRKVVSQLLRAAKAGRGHSDGIKALKAATRALWAASKPARVGDLPALLERVRTAGLEAARVQDTAIESPELAALYHDVAPTLPDRSVLAFAKWCKAHSVRVGEAFTRPHTERIALIEGDMRAAKAVSKRGA